uniref:Uncharacterized protein n=1 Tax=Plectus sambesii TaxID=2011161 RepID=A0A914WBE5_9BILA
MGAVEAMQTMLASNFLAYHSADHLTMSSFSAHHNFFGIDEHLGPVAVSMIRESLEKTEAATAGLQSNAIYRLIIRISDLRTIRVAVPEDALPEGSQDASQKSNRTLLRELLELVCPQLSFSCLRPSLAGPKTEELLLKLDEQPIYTRYKVGVMYCRAGQSTEEQMYNNETASGAFDEFLDFLGRRVRLQKFELYKGGLDTRGDTTGTHSVFEQFQQHQVMFHVSTMLPYTPSNRQQLARKRHIGNDMVTVVFQEPGALPFSPITVRSHFQHVFIIVRVNAPLTDNVTYTVAVARAKDVPAFGPPIPPGATFQKSTELHDFLLTKIINAENAVHRSQKFAAMAARTRREALKDLAENHVAAYGNEGPSRIASRFLGGSVKRKDKTTPRPILAECIRGALSWEVEVHDFSRMQSIQCILGVSADNLVLLERPSGAVLFSTPTHSILGWSASNNNGNRFMKLYYDHGQLIQLRCTEGSELETVTLLRRLESVSKGCQAQEMQLRRKPTGQLGFHLHEEGVVTDVEMYGSAWQTGLRQGSRIVEIESIAVSTLNLEQMEGWLKEKPSVRVLVIPPAADGSPRRGCEDPHCPAVKGIDESAFTVADVIHSGRQPPSYAEAFKRLTSTSPGGRTDLGYESAGWSSQAHTDFATVSSASSEERWRKEPPPYGLAPPAARTDTLSSTGSTSSEVSSDHPLHRRPQLTSNRVDPRNQMADKGPPLPPKTYKLRQTSVSVHEQLANVLQSATTSSSSRRNHLNRTHSEEFLVSSTPIHFDHPTVVSARLGHVMGPLEPRQPTAWDASVVEAAAKVLASNPEIGSCQLRLQAALHKVRFLEDKVDQLTIDLEQERRMRSEMEKEVSALKEERRLLKRERIRTENDLRQLFFQRDHTDPADC